MYELIKQLMDYSLTPTPGSKDPSGFLFFIFLVLSAVTIIWVAQIIFDFMKNIMDGLVRWRSNVAESRAKAKKNDMHPILKDGVDDILYKIDRLDKDLKDGITDLNTKIKQL